MNTPEYYPNDTYEPRKVAEAWGLHKDAYLFNVLKYIARAGKKPGEELVADLKKAIDYLQWRIEVEIIGKLQNLAHDETRKLDPYAVDWSKIPEGYDYVVTGDDGSRLAYSEFPSMIHEFGWFSRNGTHKQLGKVEHNPDWRYSLRIRPGTEDKQHGGA